MTTAIAFLILIGVLIFFHELGHFFAAKAFNIKVVKFSLGFGPKLIGKRVGETEYAISILPLGGYVKLFGENPQEKIYETDEARSFSRQKLWVRALIVAAGPLFNFALAALIFTGIYIAGISVPTAEIGKIAKGSPAQEAGLRDGDIVKSLNDVRIGTWDELIAFMGDADGSPIIVVASRKSEDGKEIFVTSVIKPRAEKTRNIFSKEVTIFRLGVMPADKFMTKTYNPIAALQEATLKVGSITKLTLMGIVKMIEGVVSPSDSIGGPIAIAQMAGVQAKAGVLPFLLLMAFLSVNLGILNLLPVPALDGGHLVFYLVEALIGKPLNPRAMELAQQTGFILLIALMVFVVFIDINRMNFSIVNDFTRIFTK